MRVFVTGVNGQLGHDVMNELYMRGYEGIGSDLSSVYCGIHDESAVTKMPYVSLDITEQENVSKVITEIFPDVVIHCAGWTAVDAAEDKQDLVKQINVDGTRYIAEACSQLGCKLLYLSTDYVFNGLGTRPWLPDDKTEAALNVYGQTKLDGELVIANLLEKYYIVRISWVFGLNGNNFVKTMLQLGKKYQTLRVVNDQIGTPTYTIDLSRLLVDMIETDKYGYYHATNEGGYISWYEFACEIFRQAGYKTEIIPVTTEQYGNNKATRPFNSRLDKSKLKEYGFTPLPHWRDALTRFLEEIDETKKT